MPSSLGVETAIAYESQGLTSEPQHGASGLRPHDGREEQRGRSEQPHDVSEEPPGFDSTQAMLATAVWEPFRDAWLAARTRFALLAELGARASEVQIEAYRGNLVLAGDVATSEARAAAEDTVRRVPGVVGVSNLLHVSDVATARGRTDAEIRTAVTAALRHARALRGSIVVVNSVYNGVVRLTGVARDEAASATAFALAVAVPGARRVINDLALTSDTADADADAA